MPLLARIVCGGDALNERRALAAKHWNIIPRQPPTRERRRRLRTREWLVSEVHDPPHPRDCIKDLRREPGEGRGGLSDDDEFTFD
jgi:hypothetical protein